MHFVIPPVELSHLAKTHDPTFHGAPLDILLPLEEHGPVLPHAETPVPGTWGHLARREHVEDEDAAEDERVVNAPEKVAQSQLLVLRVEKVVEDLADGCDCFTGWELDLEQRSKLELGLGHPVARELDHSLGDVDPENLVACVYELSCPQTTAATQVDYKAVVNPIAVQ